MILGLSTANFTLLHVIISLVAIASGIVVAVGMLGSHRMAGWTLIFLAATVLTSVTGFLFPINGFTPAIGVGSLSLLILLVTLIALYNRHLTGAWRGIYVATAMVALWFNVFVLIAQSFQKVPALKVLAPTGSEPPFLVAQSIVLLIFVLLGIAALFKFRPAPLA